MMHLSDFEKYLLTHEKFVAVALILHLLNNGDIDNDAWSFMYSYNGGDWKNDPTKWKSMAEYSFDKLEEKKKAIQIQNILSTKTKSKSIEYDLCSRCKSHAEFNGGVSNCCTAPAYDANYESYKARKM